jgi:hypothetical protein
MWCSERGLPDLGDESAVTIGSALDWCHDFRAGLMSERDLVGN